MRFELTFEAMGYRNAQGRFAQRTEKLAAERREIARDAGRMTLAALKARAPRSKPVPGQKSTSGTFARGLIYRTYERGNAVQARFYATGPHAFVLPFLVKGTRPHVIPTGGALAQMAKGYPLRFYWKKGPQGPGIYRYWSVNHPGTQPSPFIEEALADVEPELSKMLRKRARSVAWL